MEHENIALDGLRKEDAEDRGETDLIQRSKKTLGRQPQVTTCEMKLLSSKKKNKKNRHDEDEEEKDKSLKHRQTQVTEGSTEGGTLATRPRGRGLLTHPCANHPHASSLTLRGTN